MKIALRYLVIVVLAIVALTWLSVNVHSTEKERNTGIHENPAAREAFRRLQLQDEHGRIPPDALRRAYKEKEAMPFLPEAWGEFLEGMDPPIPQPWVSIGPGNIGGRIRSGAIVIHPLNGNIMWLGATGGGVWKSTDAGASWATNTDFLANLNVCCLAIDPTNPSVLYAGTGEAFRGNGIFKTTDGGSTWKQLISTAVTDTNTDFAQVRRVAISPTNPQVLLVGTLSGLFRSVNGGDSWSRPPGPAGEIWDVRFHPTDGTKCIAGNNQGNAYYSTNGGLNWTSAIWSFTPSGRVELAYSRSNPSIVFAQAAFDHGQVYRSVDGGHSFSVTVSPYSSTGLQAANGNFNALWVDPSNPLRVLAGGEYLLRTTDGGTTWSEASSTSTHVDHHVIVQHPGYGGMNMIVYGGNDGGIYRADDIWAAPPVTWTSLNHKGLVITEFYGAAGNIATGKIIGGTQDQGTLRYLPEDPNPLNWKIMYGNIGGDGGFCAADQTDPNYFYGENILLQIWRSTNGNDPNTSTGDYIYNNPDPGKRLGDAGRCEMGVCYANAPSPFILDPNNPNGSTILAGGASLWRSENVKEPNPSNVAWAAIKSPAGAPGNNISAIAVAPGNSNIIWVGHNNGSVFYTLNGTAASPTWIQANTGLPARMCTRITIGPAPSPGLGRRTYVTFGGFASDNVWETQNNGVTWANISSGLPNIPIYSLVISPSSTNTLYIGTEVGVFATTNDGTTWSPHNDGLANVCVQELFWMGPKLVAATYGRGLFTLGPPLP